MATTLNHTLKLVLSHLFQNSLDLSNPAEDFRLDLSADLANGTGAGQADQVWHDERTLVGAAESLDLAGSLTNAFGATAAFAALRGIVIQNKTTTSGANLIVGADSTAPFFAMFGADDDTLIITPGGLALLWAPNAGYTVTPTTADRLQIDSGTATIVYRIYLIGTTT